MVEGSVLGSLQIMTVTFIVDLPIQKNIEKN